MERLLVAVVRLILGDENEIRLEFQLFEVGNAWLRLLV